MKGINSAALGMIASTGMLSGVAAMGMRGSSKSNAPEVSRKFKQDRYIAEMKHTTTANTRRGMNRHARRTSKYMPHHGKQECARRVKQALQHELHRVENCFLDMNTSQCAAYIKNPPSKVKTARAVKMAFKKIVPYGAV